MKEALITVCGNSMNNLLKEGDVVLLKKGDKVRMGDILVYNYDSNIIIHRVLFVGYRYIWEAGDNNYRIRKIKRDQVIAKVVANLTRNIDLECSKINRRITLLNLSRCLLGKNITTTKKLIEKRFLCKIILAITKKRNRMQSQYEIYVRS